MKQSQPLTAMQVAGWNLAVTVLLLAVCWHTARFLYPQPADWEAAGLDAGLALLAFSGLLMGPLALYRLWQPGHTGLKIHLTLLAAAQMLLWTAAYALLFHHSPA